MAEKYFIWKNPQCNGVDVDWVEISGSDFWNLVHSPAGVGRYFLRMADTMFYESDLIVIEVTKEVFLENEPKRKHEWYVNSLADDITVLSIDYEMNSDTEDLILLETLEDENTENFQETIEDDNELEILMQVVSSLPEEEKAFVLRISELKNSGLTEEKIAAKFGIPRGTYRSRRDKIFKKIKKSFANFRNKSLKG